MRTWVIPCRYDPIVHECVASVRTHHPDDRIVVVDSCSPDKSYLTALGCDILTGNTNYTSGAYGMALQAFRSDHWAFIQDSIVLRDNLTDRLTTDLTTVQSFGQPLGADVAEFCYQERARMGLDDLPFSGVFGTMFFCPDRVARQVEALGWMDAEVPTKVEACATERTLGMVFAHLGLLVDPIAGEHCGRQSLENPWLWKHFKDRP